MNERIDAEKLAAADSQAIKKDPNTTATGSAVGISGRKGGATPVVVYEDIPSYRAYDNTAKFSDTGARFWLALLVALIIVGVILAVISPYLLFPNGRQSAAQPGVYHPYTGYTTNAPAAPGAHR